MSVVAAEARDISPRAPLAGRYDRAFYGSVSIGAAILTIVGFAPTFYLRLFSGGPTATISGGPFTPVVYLHGALFTGWILLFVTQTALISARRVSVHRRLGVIGGVLAGAMIVAGMMTGIAMARRGAAPPGITPLAFFVIPVFDMLTFGGFVAAALLRRRDKESHKRLMLLAYASILGAPAARLPGVLPLGPLGFYGIALLVVVAGVIYDYASRGRVHKAYVWGGTLLALSVPLRLVLSGTAVWQAFARAVVN